MKLKRALCMLLTMMMAFPLLTMSVFATSREIVEGCLTISDNRNVSSYADGVYTATGKGGSFSAKENTITITNTGANKANVTFDYTATGYGSFTIDGTSASGSGSINWNLTAGASKVIKIKGTTGILSGGTDGILTIKNIIYTVLIEGKATISHNNLGSITVDGAAFASGNTTGTLTETGAKLVATPASGASFVAWVNTDNNEVLSQSATFQLKPYATAMNIQAVFTTAANPAYYMTNATLYTDLSAALTAASGGDKKVVVISSGILPTGSTFNIPSGTTMLIPYTTADYTIGSSTVIDDSGGQGGSLLHANVAFATLDDEGTNKSAVTGVLEPDTSVTYTLTIPSGTILNVSGKLVVGGTLVAGTASTTGICGATAGAHSNIQLNGSINVKSGGILSTYGYIRGGGSITAESGSEVYQPFILLDHKDGHYLYAAKDNNRFPIYRYSMQNIRCPLEIKFGADLYGYSAVFTRKNTFAAARFNPSVAHMVGSGTENALYRLNSGSMTMTYNSEKYVSVTSSSDNNAKGYYNKVGTTTMTFSGDASLGNIKLSVVVMGSNYDMDSQYSEIPVPYNFQLVQNTGTFSVDNNMALLPGTSFTVNKGAAMSITSGKSLVIYDGLRDYAVRAESVTLDGDDQTGGTWPRYHYPTADNLQSGGFSRTADLIINGTLTVKGNLGGTVQTSDTTGNIVMDTNSGNSATGIFGVQNETADMYVMTIGGSCGKTERTLDAQVFTPNSTERITLQPGGSYVAYNNNSNTINSYSYKVYGSHTGSATAESKSNLNATVKGTWQCVHKYVDTVTDPTCTVQGYTTHTCSVCGHSYVDTYVATVDHILEYVSDNNATCTADGTKTATCKFDCGETSTVVDEGSALGHAFNNYVSNNNATCFANATESATCERDNCGVIDTREIENTKVDHVFETYESHEEATCTTPGTLKASCKFGCGTVNVINNDSKPALDHEYREEDYVSDGNATCTDDGTQTAKCVRCDVTNTKSFPALGHSFTSYIPNEDAKCGVDGTKTAVCDRGCGETDTVNNDGSALDHDYAEYTLYSEESCTSNRKESATCQRTDCGHVDVREVEGTMLSHVFTDYKSDGNATCIADGTETATCDYGCGTTDNRTAAGSVLGHSFTDNVISTQEATCTQYAFETVQCDRCEVTENRKVGEALGHKYGDYVSNEDATCTADGTKTAVCSVCGAKDTVPDEGSQLPHSFGDWGESKTATCTEAGEKRRDCTVCDAFETEVIPELGHTYEGVVTDPTCTAAGFTTYTCTVCGDNYTDNETDALGHSGKDPVVENKVDSTCSTEGSYDSVVYCSVCSEEVSRTKCNIATVAHSYGEWTITNNATCSAPGSRSHSCVSCGNVETEEIPVTGHSYGDWTVTKAPTHDTAGEGTRSCTVCGEGTVTGEIDAAKVGDTPYKLLSEAIAAADRHNNVVLLSDISGNVPVGKHVTIEKGSYSATIVADTGFTLAENGTATTVLVKIIATNMKASDGLDLFFYVNSATLTDPDGYVARVTRTYADGTSKTLDVALESYNATLTRFCYEAIAAKEMTDTVTGTLCYADGTPASNSYTESVKNYAMRTMKDEKSTQTLITALVDMLNYGAGAQTYFKYAEANLANADPELSKYTGTSGNVELKETFVKGDNIVGTSVSAKNKLMMTFYFQNITQQMSAKISYTDRSGNNISYTIPGEKFYPYNSWYGVDVTGVPVANGRALITCEVYDSETLIGSAADSVEGYAARTAQQGYSVAVVMQQLMRFVDSAAAYFDSIK